MQTGRATIETGSIHKASGKAHNSNREVAQGLREGSQFKSGGLTRPPGRLTIQIEGYSQGLREGSQVKLRGIHKASGKAHGIVQLSVSFSFLIHSSGSFPWVAWRP